MTSKEFLQEYRKSVGRIIRLTAELEELRVQAELPGQGFSATSVKMSPQSRLDNIVPVIVDETAKLEAELQAARKTRRQVKKAISAVKDDRYREVLTYIYICGYTIEQTSEMISCEPRTVYRRRDAALKRVRVPKILK